MPGLITSSIPGRISGKLSTSPNVLWKLPAPTSDNALPVLQRVNKQDAPINNTNNIGNGVGIVDVYSGISVQDYIDVVNDFSWTVSPKTSRADVPILYLDERRLLTNSNVTNIANSIFTVKDNTSNVASLATPTINLINNTINSVPLIANGISEISQAANFLSNTSIGQTTTKVANEVGSSVINETLKISASLVAAADQFLKETGANITPDSFTNNALKPYSYLYATEPTKFLYKLPYLENQYGSVSNTFASDTPKGLLNALVGEARTFAETTANFGNFLKPGVYIETAKQFSMADTGRSISVKIPLLNTQNQQDINNNWQLLFGLIYQNRPGRVTRSIIDLPVIYELSVPGMVYMPYSFISNLTVDFIGARRLMNLSVPIITTPGTPYTKINVIVPDAYELNITFTGLNDETRNFLYASMLPGGNGVTVGPPLTLIESANIGTNPIDLNNSKGGR